MKLIGGIPKTYVPGQEHDRLVQEWLTIQGYPVVVDGDLGPATKAALEAFCLAHHVDAVMRQEVWETLWAPMHQTLGEWIPSDSLFLTIQIKATLLEQVLYMAQRHLDHGAREIGQNQGPWIRLYTGWDPVNGHDGQSWAWCSAFVRFCIEQASQELGYSTDYNLWDRDTGWSCTRVARFARKHGLLQRHPESIPAGTIFLLRHPNSEDAWYHTGFVESYDPATKVMVTIEGNTNEAGSREGIAVMCRYRKVTEQMDFITEYGQPDPVVEKKMKEIPIE